MRRKTRAKIALSDYKIAAWFVEHPEVFAPARIAYEDHINSVKLTDMRIHRESYGPTKLSYKCTASQRFRADYGNTELPIHADWLIAFDTAMDIADRILPSHLPQIFRSGMPTHNRNWENWYKAVWDNPSDFPDWSWVHKAREDARIRITADIKAFAAQDSSRQMAFDAEREKALTRLIGLQKEYKYIPMDYWHELVNLAIVNSIHTGESSE